MNNLNEQYERLVQEEDDALDALGTTEALLDVLIENIACKGWHRQTPMLEGTITKIQAVWVEMHSERLQIQLEKAVLAGKQKPEAATPPSKQFREGAGKYALN